MQIAVPGVPQHHDLKGIVVAHGLHMLDGLRHFMHGHHEVIGNSHVGQDPQGLLTAAAESPEAVIRFQHFQRARFLAELA